MRYGGKEHRRIAKVTKMITEIRQQVPEGVADGLQDKMSAALKSSCASRANIPLDTRIMA